jgi:hypothetical protein
VERAHLERDVPLVWMWTAWMEIGTMREARAFVVKAELSGPSGRDLRARALERLLLQGYGVGRMFHERRLYQPS